MAGPEKDENGQTKDSSRIHQLSMEAGARWMLNDVSGKPIRTWDSRGHNFTTAYDALRRPIEQNVRGTFSDPDPIKPNSDRRTLNLSNSSNLLIDKIEYGEPPLNATPALEAEAQRLNLRTRIYKHSDTAGVITNALLDPTRSPLFAYDYKGNLLHGRRQFIQDYKALPDWRSAVNLEKEADGKDRLFASHTTYDALNRPLTATSPDGSIYRPTFNEANLLDKVDVNLRGKQDVNGNPVWSSFVKNIDYDAKGQRKLIEYGAGAAANKQGVTTTYDYDRKTFRLIRLTTKRPAGFNGLASQIFKDTITVQDLRYTYDPSGNITHISDEALKVVHHNNQQVEPACDYVYDALYRLIQATGREHIGQAAYLQNGATGNFRDFPYVDASTASNNPQELRNYTEQYVYDAVGNFEFMAHQAANGNWTRAYSYDEDSLIEAGKKSNRLSKAPLQSEPPSASKEFGYDPHGNMTRMQHLPLMYWDYRDQLLATAQQVVNNGMPETTWYLYDAAGQRVRKVTERMVSAQNLTNGQLPVRLKDRVYLGGFEIYREYEVDGVTPKLERESLHIMDDKQRIALIETRTIENRNPVNAPLPLRRYQFGNHLGSASLELADEGALISYEEYRPYGTSAFQAGRSVAEVSLKRYRYTGKERDEENGLYYHGARYYAPCLGRWVTCDPEGVEESISLYRYVSSNPIRNFDHTGRADNDKVDDKVTGEQSLYTVIVYYTYTAEGPQKHKPEAGPNQPSAKKWKQDPEDLEGVDSFFEGVKNTVLENTGEDKTIVFKNPTAKQLKEFFKSMETTGTKMDRMFVIGHMGDRGVFFTLERSNVNDIFAEKKKQRFDVADIPKSVFGEEFYAVFLGCKTSKTWEGMAATLSGHSGGLSIGFTTTAFPHAVAKGEKNYDYLLHPGKGGEKLKQEEIVEFFAGDRQMLIDPRMRTEEKMKSILMGKDRPRLLRDPFAPPKEYRKHLKNQQRR